jgi:SSS family solute:Na+ symporter
MFLKIAVLAAFVAMIITIGVLGMRRTRSFSDFFLGGGEVGPWMTAFTYFAAYFSAVIFIGFAGKVGWGFGYSGLWIAVANAAIGVLGVWWLMGHRIKQMSIDYNVQTMAEYFEKRYNSRFMKMFSAICVFVFFIPYSAAVFMGMTYLFQATFGIDYTLALIFMGAFTALYMVMGGYRSMTMIDLGFGIIMLIGVTTLFVTTVHAGGGLTAITNTLTGIDPRLTGCIGPAGGWSLFALVFLTSVAPFAMPQLVQKFYAVKDRRAIRIGMWISSAAALLIGGVAYYVGATTRVFLTPETAPLAFSEGKPVFDALMPELLTKIVPDALGVLILLLILAASMSTLAALVLISSSSVAKDIYAGFINPQVSDKRLTLLMRVFSCFFIILSVILAYYKPTTIVAILGISWGAIGSVFLGPFVGGLLCRRVNVVGAISSAMLGLGTCLVLYIKGMPSPEAGTIGMIVSLVSAPIASLFGRSTAVATEPTK